MIEVAFLENDFLNLLDNINDKQIDIVDKLSLIVNFIRPSKFNEIDDSLHKIDMIIDFFKKSDNLALTISNEINLLLIESKVSTNIVNLGILSKNGFSYEIRNRFYNKFLPNPPKKGDFRYIFATLFNKKNDYKWVNKIDNEKWIEFFSSILISNKYTERLKNHIYWELIYAAEILAIWIASEEFDDNFLRLDKKLLNRDSVFISLQRDLSDLIHKLQLENVNISSIKKDFEHIDVLIEQCNKQVLLFKKKSINHGISIDLTYELERLTQIIRRLDYILALIKSFDTNKFHISLVELFKESIIKNATKNSLYELYEQSIKIISKSITNNTSEHGEHYITNNVKDYIKMFLKASGAGIIIAIMALIKINIMQSNFSYSFETFFISLNYGLGFVIIHLFGFTVATKQPAMTASTFAEAIDKDDGRKANQNKLVSLIFQVIRSQFAAVAGNVTFALLLAFLISFYFISNNSVVLDANEVEYYLDGLKPFSAFFFAAIAGVWLFCSGLISGYFDNRADLLELKSRYYHHPLLKKLLKNKKREKFANYLHDHHGAIAGNFFFGVLLGITPFLGYIFNLPLDIRHVAFSTAYLGYASMHIDISISEFLFYFICVLMIGFVNLTISFSLALKVSLLSREAYFGNLFSFFKLLVIEIFKKPHHLIFPIKDKKN
ncbi:hypothetical protein CRU96_02190 [Malaciobacter halophilus]|nr:hypothetical protein CRU96_02190 [Malaciobacter halophilus]